MSFMGGGFKGAGGAEEKKNKQGFRRYFFCLKGNFQAGEGSDQERRRRGKLYNGIWCQAAQYSGRVRGKVERGIIPKTLEERRGKGRP